MVPVVPVVRILVNGVLPPTSAPMTGGPMGLNAGAAPFFPQGAHMGYGPMPGASGLLPPGPYTPNPNMFAQRSLASMQPAVMGQMSYPQGSAHALPQKGQPPTMPGPRDWEPAWYTYYRERNIPYGLANEAWQLLTALQADKALILSFAEGGYT